jgi:predicted MPP superfamily phosphohydrolase
VVALLGFVGTVALLTALIHLYLWKRLVRDTTLRGTRGRRVGGLVLLALALLIPATMILSRAVFWEIAWPGFMWLALMFYLLVALVVLEIPMLVARVWLRRRARRRADAVTTPAPTIEPALVGAAEPREAESRGAEPGSHEPDGTEPGRPQPPDSATASRPPTAGSAPVEPGHDPDRRLLLARGAAIFAGLTATGIVGYGVRTALGPPTLDRAQIALTKLPRALDGFRIALVSDIHLGPLTGAPHAERIVAAINNLDADIVAVVGDLVDGSVAELGASAAPLRDLRSRHGGYFVTGNHEYYSGHQEWIDEVARLGLTPLRNQRLQIATKGGAFDLAGVNDVTGRSFGDAPDFDAALGGRDPALPVVLLAHQPVQVHDAAKHGVDLQLSGHTHGGQMVPFSLLVRLQQPVLSGLAEIDGTKVYVTHGAGFWGPPVRVGAPPQVTLIELRSA